MSQTPSDILPYEEFKQQFQERICLELAQIQSICAKRTAVASRMLEHIISQQPAEPYKRPYYAYLGYRACHGSDNEELMKLGVALELYNIALLIQDDVFDQDEVRNGRQNLYGWLVQAARKKGESEKAAEAAAILIGDLLFGLAFAKLDDLSASGKVKKMLRQTIFEANVLLSLGQLVDTQAQFGHISNLDTATVIAGYDLKNQFNVELPIRMGTVLAGSEGATWPGQFAKPLAVAIQIVNDNDLLFSTRVDEKTTSDLRNGKPTLTVLFTWQNSNTKEKAFIKSLMGKQHIGRKEVERLKALMVTTNATSKASKVCLEHCSKSRAVLARQAGLQYQAVEAMLQLVDGVGSRAV